MKLLEIPMVAMSLLGFGLLPGLDTPAAHADFTIGERTDLRTAIPVLDNVLGWPDCFSSDGLEMYVESQPAAGSGNFDLWVSRRATTSHNWGPLENLGPAVNSPNGDEYASISTDGLTLYFDSWRPGFGSADLYVTTRVAKDSPWGPAVNMGAKINSARFEGCPRVSPNGLELYFVSPRSGGYGYWDIYVTRRTTQNEPWGEPVNLGPVVNSPYWEGNPCLSPDGLLLLFCDNGDPLRPGGYGGSDVWVTRRTSVSSPWQAPVNLGPKVNGPAHEVATCMSFDGLTLYGATDAPGNTWQVPIRPTVDFNGDGKVDAKDLALLVADWGKSDSVCDIGPFAWGDGTVDAQDVAVLGKYMDVRGPVVVHWPRSHAVEVPREVVLHWAPGDFAKTHDVYFGTSLEAVSGANRTMPLGVLVSQAQDGNTYDPPGLLEFGRTYYWRIDAVGPAPAFTVYRGPVLEFATEAYPILNVTATASSSQLSMGPEKTVDGSGLDKNDRHSTSGSDMWLSQGTQPNWIQYQFDKVYTLHELWVWNSNQLIESFLGFGAKTVKIEYSTDGTKWTALANVPEFAKASGKPDYVHNTTVNFGGVSAKFVKLTIEKGWGSTPSVGLSEVRFFYIPDRSTPKP